MASLLSSAFSALAPAGVKMAVSVAQTAGDLIKEGGKSVIKDKNILIPLNNPREGKIVSKNEIRKEFCKKEDKKISKKQKKDILKRVLERF